MKKDPRLLSAVDFDYALPENLIALHPLAERDQSRLLVYENGAIQDKKYVELDSSLPAKSWLVFNQTKVVPARILFEKNTGGLIEIFCLSPESSLGDMSAVLQKTSSLQMQCLVGGASKWKSGTLLERTVEGVTLKAAIIRKEPDHFLIELQWTPAEQNFASILMLFGQMPLPPYLKRKLVKEDQERYQTVYAKKEGSVAAPTAGLHFTPGLLRKLQERNITIDYLTLHVGAGTFKPVKAARMEDHAMHAEWIEIELEFLQRWYQRIDQPLIAVGTTSLRTLESIYWIGLKILLQQPSKIQSLSQWECYELEPQAVPLNEVLKGLIQWMQKKNERILFTQTSLLIGPGYAIKTVKGLLTNFHQPRSTLLLLVAAFVGEDWTNIYQHAIKEQYRMLSYGDGSLLWRKE
jgi:S-adenosylmethionine:tRNA ribosyltransferase-isomerase